MNKTLKKINSFNLLDKLLIKNSKKEFIVIKEDNSFILTNDLNRYKKHYINETGSFAVLSCIKKNIN